MSHPSRPQSSLRDATALYLVLAVAVVGWLVYRLRLRRSAPASGQPSAADRAPDLGSTSSGDQIGWRSLDADDPTSFRPHDRFQPDNGAVSPPGLIGSHDPVDGTPIGPGETLMICQNCRTGYHLDSWDFLQSHNGRVCVSCRVTATMTRVTLATADTDGVETHECPTCSVTNRVPSHRPRSLARCGRCHARLFPMFEDVSAPRQISLGEVASAVGSIVVFEGLVHDSYRTRSGTYFIKFERGTVPRVFKVVIFADYAVNFQAAGIRIEDYRGRWIRVRGLVQRHRRWGLEIVVTDPSTIAVAA